MTGTEEASIFSPMQRSILSMSDEMDLDTKSSSDARPHKRR